MRKIGFKWSKQLVERTLLEIGGTILASELALKYGIATNIGGGTHHSFKDHGSGFTIFNDMAVASMNLINKHKLDRIMIIDLDVH